MIWSSYFDSFLTFPNCGCPHNASQVSAVNGACRYTGSRSGSALLDFCARSSHSRGNGSSINSSVFAAIVVSSFSPVACPTPTKNPASNNVTRNNVLREYVGIAQGQFGSSDWNKSEKRPAVHMAGFFAGENASNKMARGEGGAEVGSFSRWEHPDDRQVV